MKKEFELDENSKKLLDKAISSIDALIQAQDLNAQNMADVSNHNHQLMIDSTNVHAEQIDHISKNVIKPIVDSSHKLLSKLDDHEYNYKILNKNLGVILKNQSIMVSNIKYLSNQIDELKNKFNSKPKSIHNEKTSYNPVTKAKCLYCGELYNRTHRLRKYCPSKHGIKDFCKKSYKA